MLDHENNRQQILLDLINQLEEDNCIITLGKENGFIPAVFRQGPKYQIYINQLSPYEDFEDVTDLIDDIISYVEDEDFLEYKLISHEEFGQLRISQLKEDVRNRRDNIDTSENATLKNIISNVERDIATYVVANGEVKYLIGAVSTDEDWYYMYLTQKGCELQLEFSSCVGGHVPLHRYLPAEEYKRVTIYSIEQAISDKNIEVTSQWVYNKIFTTTEYVPFTRITIKPGEFWVAPWQLTISEIELENVQQSI